jgi:hypothetical protein
MEKVTATASVVGLPSCHISISTSSYSLVYARKTMTLQSYTQLVSCRSFCNENTEHVVGMQSIADSLSSNSAIRRQRCSAYQQHAQYFHIFYCAFF